MKSVKLNSVITMPDRKEPELPKKELFSFCSKCFEGVNTGFNSLHDNLSQRRLGLNMEKVEKIIDNYGTSKLQTKTVRMLIAQALCDAADSVIVEVKE